MLRCSGIMYLGMFARLDADNLILARILTEPNAGT